jgi:hypothetical protein
VGKMQRGHLVGRGAGQGRANLFWTSLSLSSSA